MGKVSKPAGGTGRYEGSDRDDAATLAAAAVASPPSAGLVVLNALNPASAIANEAVQFNSAISTYAVTSTGIASDTSNLFGGTATDQLDSAPPATSSSNDEGHAGAETARSIVLGATIDSEATRDTRMAAAITTMQQGGRRISETIPKLIDSDGASGAPYLTAASNAVNAQLEGTFDFATLAASTVALPSAVLVNAVDPVSSTADQVLQADTASSNYNVNGSGIVIGIISDSFNVLGGAATDEADGALPSANNIDILKDGASGDTDEGRAMAEIVHSIAPGATIDFYTAGTSEVSMAAAITALQQAGAEIIVDDVSFSDEPIFEEGDIIDNAINSAVAKGVTYFTAASNAANSYYEGTFTPITATVTKGHSQVSEQAENFGTTSPSAWENVTIPIGATVYIDLQWAQPFATGAGIDNGSGATSTLDFNLVTGANGSGTLVEQGSANVDGSDPVQFVQYTNHTSSTSFSLAIFRSDQAASQAPGLFEIVMNDDSRTPVTFTGPGAGGVGTGDIFGHEEDPEAITVGAVPESDPTTMEVFSSTGPGEFVYDSNGNLLSTPVTANAVDISAPDGNSTSLSGNLNPFYGTSAAAPAAAAVGALMLEENPRLEPSDIENLLEDTATPESAGSAVAGAGLVDADAAVGLADTLTFQMTASATAVLGTHLDDTFIGGPGNHTITGEGGSDVLNYSAAPSAVTVNFITDTASNGYGGTDTFTTMYAVYGSAFDDDFILGSSTPTIYGDGGTDTINFNSMGSNGTVVLNDGDFISASTTNLGFLELSNGATFQLTAATLTNSGLIETNFQSGLEIEGAIVGAGTVLIDDGVVEVGGADSEKTYIFNDGTLKLDDASQFTGQIVGISIGAVIDFADVTVVSANFAGSTLTVNETGGTVVQLHLPSSVSTDSFAEASDGAEGTQFTLATRSISLAQATIAPSSPISLGNTRVGGTLSTALTITNSAMAPAEALDVSIASTAGAAVASGSISLLAAGQTDSTDIAVGLTTASAGAVSGTVNLALASDGANTDGLIQTPLAAQTVQLSGAVYNEASASLGLPANFIVHVNDTVAQALTVTNTAPSTYSEALIASVTSTSGAISASGTTGDIAAQSSSGAITVGFSTATAGAISGSVTVALETDGTDIDGFGPTALDSQTVNVNATVNNYALATIEELSGGGIWTESGNNYSLNLGTLALGTSAPVIDLGILNSAIGPADLLSGGFTFASPSGFTNAGFSAFNGIAAGNADSLPTVTFNTTTAGTFTETITLNPTGSNASGYGGALAAETLSITGTIAASMAWLGPPAKNLSGSWNVAGDWNPALVPTAATKAVISVGGTYTVSNTQANTVGSLTIGNAHATLAISGGSLTVAGAVVNSGTIAVMDGNRLQLTTSTTNTGSIDLDATGDATQLAVAGTLALKGTGKLVMSGGTGNAIVSNGAAATLTNQSTIVGSGTIGDADLTLINAATGVIDATGTAATLTIASAGTFKNQGSLEATGGAGLIVNATLTNTGSVTVADGSALRVTGSVTNSDTIALSGAGDPTSLVIASSVTLKGNGQVTLSDMAGNAIVSNGAAATLNNASTIVGTGTIGDSDLTLFNQLAGVIDAGAGDVLTLDTATTIKNAGTLESMGGQLTIANPLSNTGRLSVSGGTLTVDAAVTGSGSASISSGTLDFAGTVGASQTITFATGAAAGTLVLGSAKGFQGTVAGMAAGDAIDLTAFAFRRGPTLSFSGSDAAGADTVVTITDATQVATIKLLNASAGEFALSTSGYTLSSDQSGNSTAGTLFALAASASA